MSSPAIVSNLGDGDCSLKSPGRDESGGLCSLGPEEDAMKASNFPRRTAPILALADEILLIILECVQGSSADPITSPWDGDIVEQNPPDIRNIRLVCRRFCEVSSPLLLRVVRVRPDRSSLERLYNISQHPTIAKGVRSVRIDLHFHTFAFDHFADFLKFHTERYFEMPYDLKESSSRHTRCYTSEIDPERLEKVEAVYRTVAWIFKTESGLNPSVDGDDIPPSEADIEARRARLHSVHQRFSVLLREQTSILDTHEFFNRIGAAVARMPCARKMVFTDADGSDMEETYLHVTDPGTDMWDVMYELMLRPLNTYHARYNGFDIPSYGDIVLGTLRAVRQHGTQLQGLHLEFSNMHHELGISGSPLFTQAERRDFVAGLQELRDFSFANFDIPVREQMQHLQDLLSACMDAPLLHTLSIVTYPDGDEPILDIKHIMGSRPRPRVTNLRLWGVGFRRSTLAALLRQLPEAMDHISLENVCLLTCPEEEDGWETALDLLRQKTSRHWHLVAPRGAELDSRWPADGSVASGYTELFGSRSDDPKVLSNLASNAAERYVARTSADERNPVKIFRELRQNSQDEETT